MSMAYDGSNHLVGYTEKTLDKLGNRNERVWTAAYGGRGLVTGYEEIEIDDRGNRTLHNQEDIEYDFAGRVSAVVDIEHDPLNTVTVSERSGIHYDRAGLANGMDEKGTQVDGGGVRTDWTLTQGPILYDLAGRVFLRQEERVKRIHDTDGSLARETVESETFANALYNRLGQAVSHETLIETRSPDGRLTESERSVLNGATYNRLGQMASYHKEETEEGRSVETLVLPSNWEELGLHPEERLLWLENLTFLVGGAEMALDELGLSLTNGMAVSWADLSSAQKVQLLSSGQTTLNGETFRLAGATIVWEKSTAHSFDQNQMTYSRYGALEHYERSGDENGVGYVQDWTSTGFDVHDRVLGFHEEMKKETHALVVTDRAGTVYDARSLAVAYTETVRDGAAPDLVTVTETKTGHDALKRTVWTQQAIEKNGTGPDGAVDTTTTIWLGNYLYDGFDRAAAYDEVRFDGTTLKIGGTERTWGSLSAGERASILEGSLTPTGQTVEVSRVAGVAYTATDRQSGFARVTRRWGESEMAPGVSGTTALMEETHLVRAGTSFNANQQALGYKEAASSTSEPEVVRLSEVTSLVYNAAGQTAGFDALTRKMGFDLDVLETLERSGVVYNRFGQMAGYFDRTVLNGLNVERYVTGMTYDDQERLTGSRTLTRQFGMESRVYYLQGGRTLTSAEVAALLMAHPGKTLEELLASGVLTQETRMEALDETTLSVTSGLVYDDLNRVIRSVETTFGADGSITTSTLSDIGYDQWGRPAGMTMTIHLGGVVPVTEYALDGSTLTPEALDALLVQQEQSSGRTAAQLMTGWLTSGRLTTRAVSKAQDVTITTLRENMRYNQNGQVVGYRETNRDPANNIARQVSTVAIEYNRAGQASRQTSDVRLDNVDGSWTESQTVLTYRYDAAGRLQGGTSATASRTVTAVWTDTDQDGQVDRLTTLPESRASSVQEYGVFNGQAQALWQSSRQESANVGGGTSASVSSMVFQYGPHGRLMGALGVMDTRSDDGFGNRTGGAVVQLFGAPGSSLKLLSSVTETVTLGADGGSNHTVLSTVFNYDGSGNLRNARSVGHFNGTEVGLTILDGVREEVETSFVRGRIVQEYQIVMNEARVSVSTTQTHSEIPQGSVLDQTTVTTYLYDAAGRLTGASAVVSGTGTNYGWTDRDEDGDMDAWETAGTMEISGTQTYVVMNGTALVKENRTRQILRAETGSVSTSDMTVRYGYDAVGNLAWAQGTGTVDSVERAWSDTNNDGTVDTLEVAGRTLSEIRQTYAIINNQARVIRSDTTTRGVDPVTGRVLSEGEHGYSRVLTRVEFVYDAVGRLTAADGRSEGRSNVEVWSDTDMDGVIDAGEMMDQVTEVATENDYVVIQGSAQVVRSVTQSSMTVGASRSTSVNAMAFEYDRLGRLVGAVGDSFGTTTTKFWNDADADGVVDNGEMLDQVTHAETSNVFRIIRGQAVLLESRSNSSIATALGQSRTASWTRNRYDAAGRLVSATGGATGTSTTQFWNDNDMDGAVDADEMVVQTTSFETFNSYQILLGQAMLSVSRSESATRTPLTQTTTTSVTSYQYNARGQLIGAGGTATGSTTTVVWNDADQDGVMEPGERVPQTTTFSTTNTYRIMAGQAMVSEARTSSLSANGNVRTETLNITRYRYSADGVLIGATGTSTGTTITTVWNDADLDGVLDAGERVGQTTTFSTQSEYRILQGQAMVVRSDTHSVAVAGAATTVTDTRMNYQYNALGVLIGATGSTQGTTTTLVKNEPDGGSGGLVSQTSTFTTSNVYRISQGQAVVLRSTTHTVAVAGTTTTTTDSWTTNTYDRDGLLTGTTGGSSGTSATTVWNDVDMDGVQDGGEMVVQTGTFSSQNTYRVLQGQSVVTASTTHTESVAGTTSTVTDSWMTYRYDNQGMLIGADGASSGSSKTEVWNDADQDRQIDAGEIVLQTQTFSTRNTYRVVQGQAVVYESFTRTESVFDNTTTVTDSWVRYQYNAQGILWGATGGATSRATKPVWNDANQNGTIDPGERLTETSTTTTTNTYRVVQGQAVVWEARSHTVTSSGLTTTVSDNWVRYQYNAQGLLVGATGGGSGTTSTTVWNDRDRDGVMDAGELTSTTSTFTSASTYRILQGQAVVSRSTTHTVEVVGGTTTEVDNWMEFRYDARGMLIGATGGASGRRYWSSSHTSSWSQSGSTTSGGIAKSFTSVTTSTTNSYYEMRWTAKSTYIIFNGTAKPTKTDTRSSYSSQTTTNVVTNKTESWIEKRMEPVTRTKTVTTTGKDGKKTTTTVTETVMVEKTYHMTGTTKTTAWSSVYYSGGGTSGQTFLYDAQGQLVGERRHEESWDNPAIVEGGMNTSTTVTSLERGKDGRPITNYTITDGALQSGARVWGVSLSAGSTASINRLATNAGGWISQLAVNSRGEVEVTLSVFDKVVTPGKGLSWKINPGQQYMDPKALGSITIGLSADDYVNRVEGALAGVRTLGGLMRAKDAEGFRNQAALLGNQEGGWLESTQMTVFSDNKAFSLTVDRGATGAAQSTLANALGHLVLGSETSVARGLALLKAAPVNNPDNLAAWGKDLMEDGAILGFRFNLPGFDKKTGSGFVLGGTLDGNGSPHITVLQMVDGDEIKGLGVPLSKIGEPKGAPVTTVLVLLKDMESADEAGLGELVGKGIEDGTTTGLVTTIASENVNMSPIDNGFGALDEVITSSITTQPKTTVTDSWVDYRYNEEGLLVGATGGAKGTSTQQVWNDANRDGVVDPGELVSQTSSFTTNNIYRIFHGQAVVVESSTHAVTAGATGTTVTDSWVKYQYNKDGLLMGATGGTVGTTDTTVWNDANQDGVLGAGEMVQQTSTFSTTNIYRIIYGQAMVYESFTHAESTSGASENLMDSWMRYEYDAGGILVGATGGASGTTSGMVWNDENQDGVLDAAEMSNQTTTFQTTNRYRIIQGQAVVTWSSTTSTAVKADGTAYGVNEHGYSLMTTEVKYRYDAGGLLTGAVGTLSGRQVTTVWTDTTPKNTTDAVGKWVVTPVEVSGTNTYAVIHGQAMVTQSVTTSTAVKADGSAYGYNEHGYSVMTTIVNNAYDNLGRLVGVEGSVEGRQVTTVWTDTTPEIADDQEGEWVVTPVEVKGTNRYVVIQGQAVVKQSVTTTRAVKAIGTAYGMNEHGYSVMTTTVNYTYDALGRLVGAAGTVEGRQVTTVWTDTTPEIADDQEGKWVVTPVEVKGSNTYVVIHGQAVVKLSVTTSTAVKENGQAYKNDEHGYSVMTTIMNFTYDALGRLVAAAGIVEGRQVTTVWTDKNRNNTWDADETVITPVRVSGTNTYAVIQGQAVVVTSETTSTALKADGTAYGINEHGYSVMTTMVNYSYDALGRLVGATGWTTGTLVQEVFTDTTAGPSTMSLEDVKKSFFDSAEFKALPPEEQVAALYRTVLEREPDTEGSAFWVGQLTNGGTLANVVSGFYGSREYSDLMGKKVDALYRVLLGRDATADVEGRAFWMGVLAGAGGLRAVVAGIMGSEEFKSKPVSFQVRAAYEALLGRPAGSSEVDYWVGEMGKGMTLETVLGHFVASPEYATVIGKKIDALYQTALGRTPDAGGKTYWIERVKPGAADGNARGNYSLQRVEVRATNTYAVIHGQAVVMSSVTTSTAVKADGTAYGINEHGHSVMTTTVNNSYDALGRLTGATGTVTGRQVTTVWTDTTPNITDDQEGKWVATPALVNGVNTYAVIHGQAVVMSSVTTSTAVKENGQAYKDDEHGHSVMTTTVNNSYDALGRLTGATGTVTGRQVTTVWTDKNRNNTWDADETVLTPVLVSGTNTYAVIHGQAVVTTSVTTSTAVKENGQAYKDDEHGYSVMTTTVNNSYDALGRLTGATGTVTGRQVTTVWTDKNRNNTWDADETVLTPVLVSGTNIYAVIHGQAVVTTSVTTSTAVKENGQAYKDDEHGYSVMTTTVNNSYDALGRLTGATGTVTGRQVTTVWTDKNRNNTWDADETVLTPVLVSGTNTYAVIHGQAVVTTSVTTSTAVKENGQAYKDDEHGYSVMTTTVNNSYDTLGRLTGATGTVTGRQVTSVWTDKNRNNTWDADETVLTPVLVSGTNTYAVIHGQAVVTTSVTTSTAVKENGQAYKDDEHGYSVMTTTVNNSYDALGRLTGATGTVTGVQVQNVFTAETVEVDGEIRVVTNPDGSPQGQLLPQRTLVNGTNTYAVIHGQAVVTTSVTTSTAVKADGTAYGINEHGYSAMTTTINYFYDALGRMTGATGTVTGRQVTTVWTDTTPSNTEDEEGKWEIRAVSVTGTNQMVVIHGQAVVVRSETETRALNDAGQVIPEGRHGYSLSRSVVLYALNDWGQVTGAEGWTETWQTQEVRNDSANPASSVFSWERKTTYTLTENQYIVLNGQAMVSRADSTILAVDANGNVIRNDALDGYFKQTSWTTFQYNGQGILVGAQGGAETWETTQVKSGNTWESQKTYSQTNHVYAVVAGQTLVVRSVTEAWSLDANGRPITDSNAHGYTYSRSWVNYSYDALGRLVGAKGATESFQTDQVLTTALNDNGSIVGDANNNQIQDGPRTNRVYDWRKGGWTTSTTAGENWAQSVEAEKTHNITANDYAVIGGQAVIVRSVTDTYTGTQGGILGEDGAHTRTTTYYDYNEKGQLIGARGEGWTETWTTVFHDPDGNGQGEYRVVHREGTRFTQTYKVMQGRGVITSQTTVTDETRRDGVREQQTTTMRYFYNEKGQLTGGESSGTFTTTEPAAADGSVAAKTTTGTSRQTFTVLHGKLLMATSTTASGSDPAVTTTYTYDSLGRLIGASSPGKTFVIVKGQALVLKSVDGEWTTTYTYDKNGRLVGMRSVGAGGDSGGDSWTTSETKTEKDENGKETTTTVTTVHSSSWSSSWSGTTTYGIYDGNAKTLKSEINSSYSSYSNTETTTNAVSKWEETDDESGETQHLTKTEVSVLTANSSGWGGSHSSTVYAYEETGRLLRQTESSNSWEGSSVNVSLSVTSRTISDEVDASGARLTDYTLVNGALQAGARIDGVGLTPPQIQQINLLANGVGGWVSGLGGWEDGRLVVDFQYFDRSVTAGAPLTWSGTGDDEVDLPRAMGSVSVLLTPNDLNGVSSMLDTSDADSIVSAMKSLIALGQAGNLDGFRALAMDLRRLSESWLKSASMQVYNDDTIAHALVVWDNGQGGTDTMHYYYDGEGHLIRGEGTSETRKEVVNTDGSKTVSTTTLESTTWYRQINGKDVATRTELNGTTVTGAVTTRFTSWEDFIYDEAGKLIGSHQEYDTTTLQSVWDEPSQMYLEITTTAQKITDKVFREVGGRTVLWSEVSDEFNGPRGGELGKDSGHTHLEINYIYSETGELLDAEGKGWSESWNTVMHDPDGDGAGEYQLIHHTGTVIQQEYGVVKGEARLESQTTTTDETKPDGSQEQQTMKMTYQYNDKGDLIGAVGEGTFRTQTPGAQDGSGKGALLTLGVIHQVYSIIGGQLSLIRNTTTSRSGPLAGSTDGFSRSEWTQCRV
jgi:YD repeat-containing protein